MKLYVEFINDLNKKMSMIFFKLLFGIGGMPDSTLYLFVLCFGMFSLKRSVKFDSLIN